MNIINVFTCLYLACKFNVSMIMYSSLVVVVYNVTIGASMAIWTYGKSLRSSLCREFPWFEIMQTRILTQYLIITNHCHTMLVEFGIFNPYLRGYTLNPIRTDKSVDLRVNRHRNMCVCRNGDRFLRWAYRSPIKFQLYTEICLTWIRNTKMYS